MAFRIVPGMMTFEEVCAIEGIDPEEIREECLRLLKLLASDCNEDGA